MFPYLFSFEVGNTLVRFPSYTFFLGAAFLAAYWEVARSHRSGLKHIDRMFFLILITSFFGAKIFYLALHFNFSEWGFYFLADSGYVFWGGFLAATFAVLIYLRTQNLEIVPWLEKMAPAVFLGIAIGRLGCFAAGCCYGKPSNLPWSVVYSHPHTLCLTPGISLHPVPLYESLLCLAFYFFLKRCQAPFKKLPLAVMGLGGIRFFTEFFRGDPARGLIMDGWSVPQIVSFGIFCCGIWLYYRKKN